MTLKDKRERRIRAEEAAGAMSAKSKSGKESTGSGKESDQHMPPPGTAMSGASNRMRIAHQRTHGAPEAGSFSEAISSEVPGIAQSRSLVGGEEAAAASGSSTRGGGSGQDGNSDAQKKKKKKKQAQKKESDPAQPGDNCPTPSKTALVPREQERSVQTALKRHVVPEPAPYFSYR
jgi:hypothetical protein